MSQRDVEKFKKQKLSSISHCTYRRQWEKMIGVGIMSACSCWLMIWVWSWPLPDINHAHPYPTRQVDMAGWIYPSRGASTTFEQWCLCRGETLRESHHLKKLWTLNNRTAAAEDIWHPWWGRPFLLTTVEYVNHARKVYYQVFIF